MSTVTARVRDYGRTEAGASVRAFDLIAPGGATVSVSEYGAALLSVRVPDRDGRASDVVLGHADLAGYERGDAYLGALVGRVAGRIADARARLEGRQIHLAANDGVNHLHGGPEGFHRRVWTGDVASEADGSAAVVLKRTSPDGEEGYPGTLEAEVRYRWSTDHRLTVEMKAVTDAATFVNLTQHAHWNLTGAGRSTVDDHVLTIPAEAYLPVGATMLPTGELASVNGTPFDLRAGSRLGDLSRSDHPQLLRARGLDHSFVLGDAGDDGLRDAAILRDPATGRTLTVTTDQPGLQVYAGNVFNGTTAGRGGRVYRQGDGVALETQRFPGAPGHPHFPSIVLRPGETYRSRTVFRFGVDG